MSVIEVRTCVTSVPAPHVYIGYYLNVHDENDSKMSFLKFVTLKYFDVLHDKPHMFYGNVYSMLQKVLQIVNLNTLQVNATYLNSAGYGVAQT